MYLLDANVFIEASRRYYDLDFCPGFWDWLDRAFGTGDVCSIRTVYQELASGKGDALTRWLVEEGRRRAFFLDEADTAVQHTFRTIADWASRQSFTFAAQERFLDGADPWLVAMTSVRNWTVVTHEQPAPDSRKSIKLPDACEAFGVTWLEPFDFLRGYDRPPLRLHLPG